MSGGKLEGMMEVLLELEVEVLVFGVTVEEELTPPLCLDPRTILKELSTLSEGMDTIGEALLYEVLDDSSAVWGMCHDGVGLLLSFLS